MKVRRGKGVIGTLVGFYVIATLIARRRGYTVGGNVVVRCRKGHLFTTIWIPGASLKSIRLGWTRWQRCPVGSHWSLVTPVKEGDLTEEELESAHGHHDVRVP
jgi:hypothetical protein